MLQSLYIRNYALIEEIEIQFSQGLTTITGETGAGKSIMLDALGLVMGKRADVKALADESQKCIVEARYDIMKLNLKSFFDENELDYAEELIIRREVLPSGKSRAFVNDTPATLDVLQELSNALVDLHQQFDTLDLYKTSFQIGVLDALSKNQDLVHSYQNQLKSYREAKSRLSQLEASQQKAVTESEFVKYQLEELQKARLQENEYETLEQELDVLLSSEDIKSVSMEIFKTLDSSDQSINSVLADLVRHSQNLGSKDKRFQTIGERLHSILEDLKDLASESEDIFERTEFDEKRIQFVQDRMGVIHKLFKKHQVATSSELLQYEEDLAQKLSGFENLDEEIESLRSGLKGIETELKEKAEKISIQRKAAVAPMRTSLLNILAELAMPSAEFNVVFELSSKFLDSGTDQVEFYFSANKGVKPQALRSVASGGETSRFALALKSIMAQSVALSTMIFDEIDTGVSGEVAHKMGLILQELSKNQQVIVITHSPQIAAKGDYQFFVYKQEGEQKTRSLIKALNREERIVEIAKMMSGANPENAALENARILLGY